MKLFEIFANIHHYDRELTIFALKPWTKDSDAMLCQDPDGIGDPPEVLGTGMVYFLEVDITQDLLTDWIEFLGAEPPIDVQFDRIVYYAINDA